MPQKLSKLNRYRASILTEGREEVFGEDALATVELDFHQFCLAVSHSSMLIARTFKGQLVIPEFEEFCRQKEKNCDIQSFFSSGTSPRYMTSAPPTQRERWPTTSLR